MNTPVLSCLLSCRFSSPLLSFSSFRVRRERKKGAKVGDLYEVVSTIGRGSGESRLACVVLCCVVLWYGMVSFCCCSGSVIVLIVLVPMKTCIARYGMLYSVLHGYSMCREAWAILTTRTLSHLVCTIQRPQYQT